MTEFERFAQALALTESDDREVAWGDAENRATSTNVQIGTIVHIVHGAGFMAMGRWQMHPAWVDDWWPDDIGVAWSWDRLFRGALLRFWSTRKSVVTHPINLAMEFHLGAAAAARGEWDEAYALRFEGHFNALGAPEKA